MDNLCKGARVLKNSQRPVKERTLRSVENEINLLTQALQARTPGLRFSPRIEQDYLQHRDQHFLDVDRKIIIGGLIIYLLFSWSDFYLGGDNTLTIFAWRLAIAGLLFVITLALPRTRYTYLVVPVTAIGISLIGASVVYFISLLDGIARYAYHLGMIPIQVFAIVSMRLSYRAFLFTSVVMLFTYIIGGHWFDLTDRSEVGEIILALQPYFIAFWTVLILLGGYLAYVMESGFRSETIKNRLLALEAERLSFLTQQLRQLSTTDGLTQIANRRYFEQLIQTEWSRCQRHQEVLSLVMIDIDAFKEFNDTYGHQSGDDCLRRVASAIDGLCRRSADVCARYGGEEFVMLLPAMTHDEARALAQQACQRVAELKIVHRGSHTGLVTISAGVASCIPQQGQHSETLLKQADELLYCAKAAGRNRVEA